MIKKLRWKFVIFNMSVVTVIFIAIFTSLVLSTQNGLRQDSVSLLEHASGMSRGMAKPDDKNLRLPFFIVDVDSSGTIHLSEGSYFSIDDDNTLEKLVSATMNSQLQTGTLRDYALRYYKQKTPAGWRIAYADLSMENSTMAKLIRNLLIIGFSSLLVFFFISILMARWAVAPVEKAWNQQRQFVADASHELKTPLTVILSNVDMLLSHQEQKEPQNRKWSENIKAESVRMKGLVDDLLCLAQSDNVRAAEVPVKTDLSYLVTDCVLMFEPAIYESGKSLEYHVAENLSVIGNPNKLKQLTEILLDNALKYSREDGSISIELQPAAGKSIRLMVSSSGEAIPPDQIDRIFERFYRVDPSRQNNGGHGLGLAIAQSITEEHKGKIWAESTKGINSFYVQLPWAK